MKKSNLIVKGFTEEQIRYIFAENGKDVNAEKLKTKKVIEELEELKKHVNMHAIKKENGVGGENLDTQKTENINCIDIIDSEPYSVDLNKENNTIKIQIVLPTTVNRK